MSQSDNAIIVKNLHKSFRLPHEKQRSIKSKFISRIAKSKNKGYEIQHVLRGVNFEIKKGEFFGIVGRNGSGKSTLLKCLAKIYTADSGYISIDGTLTPFIELGVGFNPDLTGRENVYLNGALLGFSRTEMNEKYDEIVHFAELEEFMDQKLRNYSSGMQVRLAFSIAIQAESDILLLDEVLAVGDAAFQQKCYDYFTDLKERKKTIVLVTHSMDIVLRFCDRALLVDDGEVKSIGDPELITEKYEDRNNEAINNVESKETKSGKLGYRENNYFTVDARAIKNDNEEVFNYYPKDELRFKITIVPKVDIKEAFVGLTIKKTGSDYVFWTTTEGKENTIKSFKKNKEIHIDLRIQNIFGENNYFFNVVIKSNDRTKEYINASEIIKFKINNPRQNGWMLHPQQKLTIEE